MALLPPCSETFKRSLLRATSAARAKGRTHPGPQDLLIALIEDEDASPVLQACGIDLTRLRRDVETAGTTDPTTGLGHLLQLAFNEAQLSERTVVTGADILVELFAEPVGRFLLAQGATRYDALVYLSHGIVKGAIADVEADRGEAADLEVVLLNDPYTPAEFVTFVLENVFGMSRERATAIVFSTHARKRGSCGVFPRTEAVAFREKIQNLAAARQHPLRCVLLPAGDAPPA
ncbi:ATP-dependent Clp protease adapter protein ClpS [Bradyrhizobium huanghuaihaiense]|uniref:ATP-dependent Clp protease adapter protein ClpS n=1 Tax=Bradyrhizobium huanghuaihaiense TaxID=990078 RepID=A0A562S5B9_9BRAD|nr:ATP-dependent Clp protease adaptor ClpS [Bradyrhizobium huanghuaihaiense]TWI76442.1 ATP-dependent Clp protease ATP-binding subunit ClpA [Bradyrhizobium huanghuaihaiense]